MTTSRIVRGTKTRIFLCVCGILIITAVIACYNNALTQLMDARKSIQICHQQEENLSTQLQVISDYKQRLEKSLKTEKAEHQQTKTELENKLNEEHTKNEKTKGESDLRFNSLQQHFNLLQTQHDDFKEECGNTQNKQLNEINLLQTKLKEVQDELKNVQSSKENLKTEYLQLQMAKVKLENQLKSNTNDNVNNESRIAHLTKTNQKLQKEFDDLKQKCPSLGYDFLHQPPGSPAGEHMVDSASAALPARGGDFGKLRQVNPGEYEIDRPLAPGPPGQSETSLKQRQSQNGNVADQPPPAIAAPAQERSVLANPAAGGGISSSQGSVLIGPSKSTTVSALNVSQGSLNGARPIGMPTVTPSKQQRSTSKRVPESAANFLPLPYRNGNDDNNKKVPAGIVRVPGSAQENEDLKKKEEQQDNNELPKEAIDDRYRNKIESDLIKEDNNKKADEAEKENGAHEVFDQPLHNNGAAAAAGNAYDMLRFDDVNNNNNADKSGFYGNNNNNNINNNNIKVPLDNGLLDARDKDGGGAGGMGGDYKDVANDVQLEEHDPDEEEDADDYGEHMARQRDPAIRN